MHAALKQKFLSCFLNTPDLQQVDEGVQSPWGIYFSDKEPLLGFRVAPSIEFVEATSHGTNPHTECPFLPTANTCANTLYLPRRTNGSLLPSEE